MRSDMCPLPAASCRSSVFASRDGEKEGGPVARALLPQTESLDHALVAREVAPPQIVEHAPALSDELQQATPGMMVFQVHLEVLRQIRDPIGQKRNLDLR